MPCIVCSLPISFHLPCFSSVIKVRPPRSSFISSNITSTACLHTYFSLLQKAFPVWQLLHCLDINSTTWQRPLLITQSKTLPIFLSHSTLLSFFIEFITSCNFTSVYLIVHYQFPLLDCKFYTSRVHFKMLYLI